MPFGCHAHSWHCMHSIGSTSYHTDGYYREKTASFYLQNIAKMVLCFIATWNKFLLHFWTFYGPSPEKFLKFPGRKFFISGTTWATIFFSSIGILVWRAFRWKKNFSNLVTKSVDICKNAASRKKVLKFGNWTCIQTEFWLKNHHATSSNQARCVFRIFVNQIFHALFTFDQTFILYNSFQTSLIRDCTLIYFLDFLRVFVNFSGLIC